MHGICCNTMEESPDVLSRIINATLNKTWLN
jgi:hypothetical protein